MWSNLAETCTRDSAQGDTNGVLRIFGKFKFLQKRDIPKVFTFGPTLTPFFPLKMAKIENNKEMKRLNSAIGLSKNRKIKTVSLVPFQWKLGLLFALFECFLGKIRAWSQVKGPESKFDIPISPTRFPSMFQCKKFDSRTSQFCGYRSQVTCFFNFKPLFQVWLLFWVPRP